MHDMLSFDPKTLQGLRYIAGVDLSFPLGDNKNAVACLVVMSMPELEVIKKSFFIFFCLYHNLLFFKVVYKKFLETKLYLPYISGYLAFREVGPILKLIDELKTEHPEFYPQIMLVDGNFFFFQITPS